jgi:hypothetical protein
MYKTEIIDKYLKLFWDEKCLRYGKEHIYDFSEPILEIFRSEAAAKIIDILVGSEYLNDKDFVFDFKNKYFKIVDIEEIIKLKKV